jgi:hypothetical protein
MENQGMNRREFLLVAGGAAVALPLAAALSGCGSGSSAPASAPAASNGDLTFTSVAGSHTHVLTIKAADLTSAVPLNYTTSSAGSPSHTHTVTITAAQFNDINGGKPDTIGTNPDATGHSHDFDVHK